MLDAYMWCCRRYYPAVERALWVAPDSNQHIHCGEQNLKTWGRLTHFPGKGHWSSQEVLWWQGVRCINLPWDVDKCRRHWTSSDCLGEHASSVTYEGRASICGDHFWEAGLEDVLHSSAYHIASLLTSLFKGGRGRFRPCVALQIQEERCGFQKSRDSWLIWSKFTFWGRDQKHVCINIHTPLNTSPSQRWKKQHFPCSLNINQQGSPFQDVSSMHRLTSNMPCINFTDNQSMPLFKLNI